jgi:hypothetical protein
MKVPWLSKQTIGAAASGLIADYEAISGYPVTPPIPVEDMIERSLGLTLSFEDLETILGSTGVLGATYVGARLICINERLLEQGPEGRLIFTCAHEVGHWVLHRRYAQVAKRQSVTEDVIVCRTGNARERIEWQADYFAGCLLMPEEAVVSSFHAAFARDALVLHNTKSTIGPAGRFIDPCVENWARIAAMMCEAGGFTNVSMHAMIIRLQELGLLINRTDAPVGWEESAASW